MKALTRALLLIALLMALATGFSSVAQAGPAILIETNSFLVWDGDGNEVDIADFNGWAFLVITDSADGVITVRGKVQGLDNHTGRAVIYDSDSNLGRAAGNAHKVLEHLYERPSVSVKQVQEITGTTYAAANQLVAGLVEQEILYEFAGQRRHRRLRYEPYIRLFAEPG